MCVNDLREKKKPLIEQQIFVRPRIDTDIKRFSPNMPLFTVVELQNNINDYYYNYCL